MHVSFEPKIGYFLTTDAYEAGSETAQVISYMGYASVIMDNSEERYVSFADE